MKSIYCVKDTKGGFVQPVTYPNDEIAKRAFTTVFFNNSDELMVSFPTDYELWKIGKFDDRTGNIKPELELIITGVEASNIANKAMKKNKGGE